MSEYTAKRARTRGQLLAAAHEMLPGSLRRGLDQALGPGAVAQRAGLSRQTWYRYWRADDSGFLDELTSTALASVDLMLEPVLDRVEAPTIHEVALAHFGLLTQPRVALIHLLVATLAVEDQFLEAETGTRPTLATNTLLDHHRRLQARLVGLYEPALAAAGLRPRPPLDLGSLIDGLGAFADGYALRFAAVRDPTAADTFAVAVETGIRAASEPVVDGE